jgi:hypothetical protein
MDESSAQKTLYSILYQMDPDWALAAAPLLRVRCRNALLTEFVEGLLMFLPVTAAIGVRLLQDAASTSMLIAVLVLYAVLAAGLMLWRAHVLRRRFCTDPSWEYLRQAVVDTKAYTASISPLGRALIDRIPFSEIQTLAIRYTTGSRPMTVGALILLAHELDLRSTRALSQLRLGRSNEMDSHTSTASTTSQMR